MDKFRIQYKCHKTPDSLSNLKGFRKDRQYTGRHFNGWYEISPEWGSGMQTIMLDNRQFEEYFVLQNQKTEEGTGREESKEEIY